MKLLKLSFLLILAVLLPSARSEGAEPIQPKETISQSKEPELHYTNPKKKKLPTDKPLFVEQSFRSHLAPTTAESQTHQKEPNTDQPANSTWLFNLFLVVFTGSLVAVGIGQACIYKRQATFARRTLRAIRRQANIAEKSLTLLERAWIDIEIDSIVPAPNEAQHLGASIVTVNIRNSGKSPAFIKHVCIPTPEWTESAPVINIILKPTEPLRTM